MAETVAAAAMVVSALTAATSAGIQNYHAKKSESIQKHAQEEARQAQQEADTKAETERLQALAKNQETEAGFDFGVDSALAKRYADAAQKWGAGTGSMNQEEEDNPFYMKGLV